MVTSRKRQHNQWQRRLSKYWQEKGRPETCEVQFDGCWQTYGLAPAHSKDRRDIYSYEDFAEVVAACEQCHFALDRKMSKDERLRIVKEIIEKRDVTVEPSTTT